MGRNFLWFRRGDAANAVLAAAGYNFRRLIRWLSLLLRQILGALLAAHFGDCERRFHAMVLPTSASMSGITVASVWPS